MSDRPSIEKEIADTQQTISQLEKDIKQLRDWISSNERAVGGMPESLRRITEDGITRARADLGYDPQVTFEEGMERTLRWYQSQKNA